MSNGDDNSEKMPRKTGGNTKANMPMVIECRKAVFEAVKAAGPKGVTRQEVVDALKGNYTKGEWFVGSRFSELMAGGALVPNGEARAFTAPDKHGFNRTYARPCFVVSAANVMVDGPPKMVATAKNFEALRRACKKALDALTDREPDKARQILVKIILETGEDQAHASNEADKQEPMRRPLDDAEAGVGVGKE